MERVVAAGQSSASGKRLPGPAVRTVLSVFLNLNFKFKLFFTVFFRANLELI